MNVYINIDNNDDTINDKAIFQEEKENLLKGYIHDIE